MSRVFVINARLHFPAEFGIAKMPEVDEICCEMVLLFTRHFGEFDFDCVQVHMQTLATTESLVQ